MSEYTYEREDDGIFTIHRPDGSPLATVDTQEDAEFIVAELNTQAATIEKCREALEPFAQVARGMPCNWPDGCSVGWMTDGRKEWYLRYEHIDVKAGPTAGQYKAALAALSALGERKESK